MKVFLLAFAISILLTSVMIYFCGLSVANSLNADERRERKDSHGNDQRQQVQAAVPERTPLIESRNASLAQWVSKALAFIMLATVGVGYILWLWAGCKAFLPFISDLGIYGVMRFTFPCGCVVIAALMAFTFYRVSLTRHALCVSLGYKCLNVAGSAGLLTATCGVGVIGFYPWSTHLGEHMNCVFCIFLGGFVWGMASARISREIARASNVDEDHSRRSLQAYLVVVSLISWAAMNICMFNAHIRYLYLWTTLHMASTNFPEYCQGTEGSWHGSGLINTAAFMEWILLGSLLGTVIASAPCMDMPALHASHV